MNHSVFFNAGRNGMILVGALEIIEKHPKELRWNFAFDENVGIQGHDPDYLPIYFESQKAIEMLGAAIREELEHERQTVLKAAENPNPLQIFEGTGEILF